MLTQRMAGIEDGQLLFRWKNDPDVRLASFQQNIIPLNEHINWLKETLKKSSILIYIVEKNFIPIGMYRLERTNKTATLSISVNPKYRRQGMGKRIIEKMVLTAKNLGIKKLIAEVKINNLPSNNLFLSSGFIKVREGKKDGSPYSTYEFNVK